ncbi:D-aspartate oxidase [Yamadazyma tenuis]|uniref:FAD dependent oxidoreductase domain-containing protein n=1 Tax=Candida tenuis (strain ATCC 10573 / BCRC 21748 / CBS 615 / JCM 9827 / NBRC 10315 / NRRL Y-1498 / VKM Y-70) TaxID=590646 RepID=G3B6F5_CANTC|nr:uncharacterized protein CANTEDRAFT_123756 [Yamadazyma tenuis ATCC 10573]EGV63455.1 hypothetical protein CANTEDRAFT_123756 [Yamadazyma tenuis ATCC 10573]WEJ96718.1 D-aspartate oxidase [Yamadazyma tenuis]
MEYVVIGSGIIGLYTALNLLERFPHKASSILVVAEFLPGDESNRFTSPYAGGNFSCISGSDSATLEHDRYTYTNLKRVCDLLGGPECGLDYCYSTEYFDEMPSGPKIKSIASYLDEYRVLAPHELKGAAFGIRFRSFSFNCPVFLVNLKKYLQTKGVQFKRQKLERLEDAFGDGVEVVFNCTGLGAFSLKGVDDKAVYPVRGQVLLVKAPHITENTMRWGKDYATYLIKRPYSNDQLILGGYIHKGNWSTDVLSEQTRDILERTSELIPELFSKNPRGPRADDLEILRGAAGLRPGRDGGVRIEREKVYGKTVIHNYGAGGYGFQAGLGMGRDAVALLRESRL